MTFPRALIIFAALLVLGLSVFGLAAFLRPEKHILPGASAGEGVWRHTEEGEYYRVDIKVPERTPLASREADERARLSMEKTFGALSEQFKDESGALSVDLEEEPWMEGRRYEFAVGFQGYRSPEFASYRFDIYQDTGGAHPNAFYRAFVFDERGTEVELAGVLSRNPSWLEELSLLVSNAVVEEMKERLGEDDVTGAVFPEGLSPNEENFKNFVVDGSDLVIFIPPYQVAAYAMGTFEVRIPLADIAR